jgi:ribosome-binding factor A
VLWVSHAVPYPPKAGFLLRAYHLLKGVAARHEVDLVAFVQEAWFKTIYGDVAAGIEEARRELSSVCRSVHFVPISSMQGKFARHRTALRALLTGRSYTTTWLDQPDAQQLIADLTRKHRYDLVHFDTIGLAPLARAIPDQAATLNHHNIESHLFTRRSQTERGAFQRWYFAREGRLLRQAEFAAMSRFPTQITCSDLDSERLREIEPKVRIECVPNGVDVDYFKPSPGEVEKPNSFTFIGTLNWHPNSDAMIFFLRDVWPQLRKEIAVLVHQAVRDHALPSVSVSDVEVTKDLDMAKVFVTTLLSAQSSEAVKALNAMAFEFRRELSRTLKMRRVPEIRFLYDDSVDRGERIESLLRENAPTED